MSVAERARAIFVPVKASFDEVGGRRGPRFLLEEAGVAAGAVVLTLIIAAIVLQAWNLSLHRPLAYEQDTLLHAMMVKSVLQHGWYLSNPNLGAPYGQQMYDFPIGGDNLHFLVIKILGLFSSNEFVVQNLFVVLTFVFVTLSAYLVLRCLHVSRAASAGISILYCLLPYHFFRAPIHPFLAAYYAVPLSVLLVVWALGDAPLVWREQPNDSRPLTGLRLDFDRRRCLAALGCCVVVGSTDGYYTAFAIVALLGGGVIVAIGRRGWRNLATCAVLAVIIIVVLAVNLAPTFVYEHLHGVNTVAGHRYPPETELYGLRIAQLFLPVGGHRLSPFADLTARFGAFPLASEGSEALGLIFAVGLIALLGRGLASRAEVGSQEATWRQRTLNSLALTALIAMLVGATAGGAAIIALTITPHIRAWNRISVLIAFCAAAGLGILLDQLFRRLHSRRWRLTVPPLVMVVLVVLGSLDQTTSRDVPDNRLVSERLSVNGGFVRSVQGYLPHGSMVFQLPYLEFPEAGSVNGMQDYEEVQGYLFSDSLKWSYGAMKGRPEDFSAPLSQYPPPLVARAVTVAGFSAIYVDRTGYSDNGADVDRALSAVVGPPVVTSTDGSLELYDLRPLAARLRSQFSPAQRQSLSYAVLHPVTVVYGSDFNPLGTNPSVGERVASNRGQLYLYNPDKSARALRFDGSVATPGSASSTVTVAGPGVNATVSTTSAGTPLSIDLRVPPGRSVVTFTTDAPAAPGNPRDLHLRLVKPGFTDPDLAPLQS